MDVFTVLLMFTMDNGDMSFIEVPPEFPTYGICMEYQSDVVDLFFGVIEESLVPLDETIVDRLDVFCTSGGNTI